VPRNCFIYPKTLANIPLVLGRSLLVYLHFYQAAQKAPSALLSSSLVTAAYGKEYASFLAPRRLAYGAF